MATVAPTPVTAPVSRSKSPTPKKATPDIVINKAEATVNVEDVPSSGGSGSEEKKPDDSDLTDPALRDEKAPSPTPQRPSIRPVAAASAMRSNFDLELNPFEQSFRASSHHGSSSSVSDKGGKRASPPRGGDETSMRHNALPPLSSLTSPAAADPSQFPWLAAQSLRTGPLSPAMLGGPSQNGQNGNRTNENTNGEHQAFDPSNFRTGFTPGTGSGFTPGYNSLMNGTNFSTLPLPSPNTAAFLNMVTNSTPLGDGEGGASNDNNGDNHQQQNQQHGQGQGQGQGQGGVPSAIPPHMQSHGNMPSYSQNGGDQETITPGTFSALTGALNDMNRANGQHQQGPPGLGAPPYYNMNGPAPHHQMHQMPGHPHHPQPHIDYAQQSANAASQAANGLFLLSQAHQELSKREEEGKGPSPLAGKRTSVGAVPPGSGKTPAPNPPANTGGGGQKRKSDASAAAGAGTGGKGGKKGKKALAEVTAPVAKDESASPSFSMMMDDDDDGEPRMINGKPETEEDKRKNFLERNRQAALKCRQRKKAWLTELQQKVDSLSTENEALQRTVGGLHEEIGRLTNLLMQRDQGMGVPQPYGRPIR